MPISTYMIQLMKKAASVYSKLVDIKTFPDLIGKKEAIDVTTLSDAARRFIEGIRKQETLEFDANYDKTDFATLRALEGSETDLAVWFGADGSDGKFEFSGYLSVSIQGGGVNEAVGMHITIMPSSDITPDND